ncbi:hypothetical protein [Rickettsiales endosymbiont of Stachyamoeba lipophora]|uniref:hypothetical protein n=1 Tax=Rickettsiales endosymbiont of Stachyamoeba lipophora TaxID=2486578 RepID=UPI000F6C00EF|nr:hypothetical protein [Rickettsiales endosymbiont of Stachyamoeba lipophora]AZL16354.1 hypothetical protein EF513_07435 [Rickettsiales endosymbiont of Stachyamoeba lipophora]
MEKIIYLKNNVRIIPLIWKWYAWSYLIAPHTAALNIVHRHIKIELEPSITNNIDINPFKKFF